MKYLFLFLFLFFSSCVSFDKFLKSKDPTLNSQYTKEIQFKDIDDNNDSKISNTEFTKYKQSIENSIISPNVNVEDSIKIFLCIICSVILFCSLPRLCVIAGDLWDKAFNKERKNSCKK
jgi:hypothetical protein